MKKAEFVSANGKLSISKTSGRTGETEVVYTENLVVDIGLKWIAARMTTGLSSAADITAMGVGTSDVEAAKGQQKLIAEVHRNSLQSPVSLTVDDDFTIIASALFGVDEANAALTEAGLFTSTTDNAGGATVDNCMVCRTTFPVVTKEQGDTITITWTIQITPNP